MLRKESIFLLTGAAITGNTIFTLWILYNGINAGFKGTLSEKIPYFTLLSLFAINTVLLFRGSRKKGAITTEGIEEKASLTELLYWVIMAGNILFMLWMTYRRITENFKGTIYQQISYIGLMGLLSVTIVLFFRGRKRPGIVS